MSLDSGHPSVTGAGPNFLNHGRVKGKPGGNVRWVPWITLEVAGPRSVVGGLGEYRLVWSWYPWFGGFKGKPGGNVRPLDHFGDC